MSQIVRKSWIVMLVAATLWTSGCGKNEEPVPAPVQTPATEAAPTAAPAEPNSAAAGESAAVGEKIRIGVIAKSQSNPVFQAARTGAQDAGKELSASLGIEIEIIWKTPNDENAQEQADYIEQLANTGIDGIAVSRSDGDKLTPAINDAVENMNVAVVCFDSDAPNSKRMAYHGVDDVQCGKDVMRHLAETMGGAGTVAILGGNQNAPNLQARIWGVWEEAKAYPDIKLLNAFFHKETPQDAAAKVEEVMQANPEITGWAMIGGWPLFTENALNWEPGTVKVVAVDALPAQLGYLRTGHVQILLAQQVYEWGHRSVELLVDKIHGKKDPENVRDISALVPVTKDNVDEFEKNWEKWLPNE